MKHRNRARRDGWEPTHCDGFLRRLYVRPGSGKYSVAIGYICDGCSAHLLDDGWQTEVERFRTWKAPRNGAGK